VLHICITSCAFADSSALYDYTFIWFNNECAGVDADGGYSQDKRALRGASTIDKTSSDTADIADTSSLTSGTTTTLPYNAMNRDSNVHKRRASLLAVTPALHLV
jgi:hypothetical protein